MIDQSNSTNSSTQECLRALGISLLSDWDVFIFVYRHRTNLSSADQMARFLGYTSKAVGASLDRLESKGLIQRSRYSHGVRFYELTYFTAPGTAESCLKQLLTMAENRAGRLVVTMLLRQNTGLHIAAREGSK